MCCSSVSRASACLRARRQAEQAAFEELLGLPDPQIAEYLLGGIDPPGTCLAPLVGRSVLMSLSGPIARFYVTVLRIHDAELLRGLPGLSSARRGGLPVAR